MSEDFSERRPYNAAAEFVDANVARGLGDKPAFIDPQRTLTYGELQTADLPLCLRPAGAGIASRRIASRC